MFKFVVICAFIAAASADPQVSFLSQPVVYSSVYPGSTTITKSASSVVHPSPYYTAPAYYNAAYPLAHLIKKRSVAFTPYFYDTIPKYVASAPLVNVAQTHLYPYTAINTPVTHYTTAHLIKKRSAPLLPASYVTPSYIPTAIPTTYSGYSTYYPGSYYNYASNYYPIAATHLIKKRSATLYPATSTYITPATYTATAPIYSTAYTTNPYISTPYFNNPFLYSTYIKK